MQKLITFWRKFQRIRYFHLGRNTDVSITRGDFWVPLAEGGGTRCIDYRCAHSTGLFCRFLHHREM